MNSLIPDPKRGISVFAEGDDLEKIGDRLFYLREKSALTQQQLADLVGTSQANITRWENNVQTPRQVMLGKLATALGTSVDWLVNGGVMPFNQGLPLVGYVGAGAALYPVNDYLDNGSGDEEYVTAPFIVPLGSVAVTVRGNSMYPEMDDGDVLIYKREAPFVPEQCVNKRCVVQLEDDQVMVKRVRLGRINGTFDLESTNAPTMENVKILWAAPILGIVYR